MLCTTTHLYVDEYSLLSSIDWYMSLHLIPLRHVFIHTVTPFHSFHPLLLSPSLCMHVCLCTTINLYVDEYSLLSSIDWYRCLCLIPLPHFFTHPTPFIHPFIHCYCHPSSCMYVCLCTISNLYVDG